MNYLSGIAIRCLATLILRFSTSFRHKYLLIKTEILNLNSRCIKLNENLVLSVIEIEDKRYFRHSGIDIYSMWRAMFKNITTSRIEGASTIAQQLVRNVVNDREVRVSRKVKEIMLATLIDKEFGKDEILVAYLETYCFYNAKGLSSFCRNENYDIHALSWAEAAQIAARLKYPRITEWNYIKYLKRVRTIEKKCFARWLQ